MRLRSLVRLGCPFALILAGLSGGSALASDKTTVKLGVALRLAPEKNSFAQQLYEGIEVAVQEANATDGISFELVKFSHKEGEASLQDAAKKMLEQQIQYVLGGEMTDDAFTLAESFEGKSVLLLTPTASHPMLTAGRPYVFRACSSDDQVARLLAKYLAQQKGVRSIGVLHNTSNAYSDFVTNAFLDEYEKIANSQNPKQRVGISEFRYASENPKFDGAVEQFKKAEVQWVVAFTLQESLKNFVQAAKVAKFTPRYLGSDGWGPSETVLKAIPEINAVHNEYWNSNSQDAAVLAFKKKVSNKTTSGATSWHAIGYDSARVLMTAIRQANNPKDVAQVAQVLGQVRVPGGITSPVLQFGRNQTLKKPLYLVEMTQGKVRFLKALE